jgi:hypothetical protein
MAFQEFSSALPQEDVLVWTSAVKAWELDSSELNPFEVKEQRKFKLLR